MSRGKYPSFAGLCNNFLYVYGSGQCLTGAGDGAENARTDYPGECMTHPVPTKGYLFDFDGTLVDTMGGYADLAGGLIHEAFPEITAEKGRELYIRTSGIPFIQQMELIRPGKP